MNSLFFATPERKRVARLNVGRGVRAVENTRAALNGKSKRDGCHKEVKGERGLRSVDGH